MHLTETSISEVWCSENDLLGCYWMERIFGVPGVTGPLLNAALERSPSPNYARTNSIPSFFRRYETWATTVSQSILALRILRHQRHDTCRLLRSNHNHPTP
jgi:hypothetical protein